MCGIFCVIQKIGKTSCECLTINDQLLKNRGPDLQSHVNLQSTNWNIHLAGYVLWLQGEQPVKQPVCKENNYLLLNGDIFGGSTIKNELRLEKGDTIPLLEALNESQSVISVLGGLEGPYAIIYYRNNKLYFARDPFGRRSLLIGYYKGDLVISSVLKRNKDTSVIEIPPLGVFSIDVTNETLKLELTPWSISSQIIDDGILALKNCLQIEEISIDYMSYTDPISKFIEPEDLPYPNFENLKPNELYETFLTQPHWINLIQNLRSRLIDAVHIRAVTQPQKYSNSIGLLFSGGLDCTILAALCHQTLPITTEINLFNVAFTKTGNFLTPDRKTGLESFQELQKLYPDRLWKFNEIDIEDSELSQQRSNHITHLIHPLKTILDDSLGCALWFASQTSESRLLFVGMGADELFGGYTRHRNAFRRGGWEQLNAELQQDWNNLPHRNLARDDRVVSDHGIQLRTPYLDENFVKFVASLKVWEKCYLSDKLEQGVGDKLLLRLLAFSLGFKYVPFFRKRALQFGSRIANSKENAKDISMRLEVQ